MTIYVSELPKKCADCPFYKLDTYVDVYGYQTNSHECVLDGSILTNSCPLHSISDYTKQVRRDVCEQVYKVFTNETMWKKLKDWWLNNGSCKELKECLDMVAESVPIENIVKNYNDEYRMLEFLISAHTDNKETLSSEQKEKQK